MPRDGRLLFFDVKPIAVKAYGGRRYTSARRLVLARAQNDYNAFRPWLDRQLDLKQEYISCFEPTTDPYDVLLEDFEPGTTTAEVAAVFARLKDVLVPLIAEVSEPDIDGGIGSGPFPDDGQRSLGLAAMTAFGFDPQSFRRDTTVRTKWCKPPPLLRCPAR